MVLQLHSDDSLASLLDQLRVMVTRRIKSHLQGAKPEPAERGLPPLAPIFRSLPELTEAHERWILLISLAPHLQPGFFDAIISEHLPSGGDLVEFGGTKGTHHRGVLPTGETIQFLLAGMHVERRLELQRYFSEEHVFARRNVLWLEPVREGEPSMSGRIVMSQEWVDELLFGRPSLPKFGAEFPARRITTSMQWEDVVLHPRTAEQVGDLAVWLEHHEQLAADENLGRKLKPGYRVLFYGPSGTGKTLTAALLGKQFDREVYRIDLSQIVSKYIGETEKNLEQVFKRAENRDWILFFDEADALFGKRTSVQSAHDKYANQEVSYLLQRVEDYRGLLVLASNYKNNLDDAFLRRFHSLVHFPLPGPNDRLALWTKSLPSSLELSSNVSLRDLAREHEMTGASILNAVQYAALRAYARHAKSLTQEDLVAGVRKEFLKEQK